MARFGLKQGKDLENLVVHFKQEFLGITSSPSAPPTPLPLRQSHTERFPFTNNFGNTHGNNNNDNHVFIYRTIKFTILYGPQIAFMLI